MQKDLTKRLPAELLTMIFQAWKDACGAKRYGLDAEWVRATRVCKTWCNVALDAIALWSSVLISWHTAADNPALEMQLDRARSVPLDLSILCARMSEDKLKEAFRFVLSRTKSVKQLQIIYHVAHQAVVKKFVKDVGLELVSLSLTDHSYDICEWKFTPDIFPRLRHLDLDNVVPTPGSQPLLTLTRLEIADPDRQLREYLAPDQQSSMRVHRFLASCPNLESLRTEWRFEYPPDYSTDGKLIVALPKLRDLCVEESISDLAKILGSLRVQPSTSFHITRTHHMGDFTTLIIPRNVGEARRTRHLTLMVGQRSPNRLILGGHLGDDTATVSGDERQPQPRPPPDWSITIPDLRCFPSGKPHYLGLNGLRFLTHIPLLIVPSLLVGLRLHFAHGLPVARDWPGFFATMPYLRTLELGGHALVAEVLTAFLAAGPPLCGELQDVAFCAATGRTTEETRLLSFFREVVGGWVQKRARERTGLRSLTIRLPADHSGSRTHGSSSSDSGDNRKLAGGSHAEPTGLASKLREELAWPEDVVGRVVIETVDCPACGTMMTRDGQKWELPFILVTKTYEQPFTGAWCTLYAALTRS